jgi:hypothetical protein
VERVAGQILRHRFPIFGITVETGSAIDWRRDYLHGVSTGTPYFRRSPYLDFSRAGDHKVIWELNRHQHLPLLAQAFLLSGRREYLDEAFRQVESWLDANPFLRGINWASALEVAFRALSWAWLWHMAGSEMPEALRARFLTALERHGRYLERNLSVYFSPNTHLLGEAVALHALGVLFPAFPRRRAGRRPAAASWNSRWSARCAAMAATSSSPPTITSTRSIFSAVPGAGETARGRTTPAWFRWPSTWMRCSATTACCPSSGTTMEAACSTPMASAPGLAARRWPLAPCCLTAPNGSAGPTISTSRRRGGWERGC